MVHEDPTEMLRGLTMGALLMRDLVATVKKHITTQADYLIARDITTQLAQMISDTAPGAYRPMIFDLLEETRAMLTTEMDFLKRAREIMTSIEVLVEAKEADASEEAGKCG